MIDQIAYIIFIVQTFDPLFSFCCVALLYFQKLVQHMRSKVTELQQNPFNKQVHQSPPPGDSGGYLSFYITLFIFPKWLPHQSSQNLTSRISW